MNGRYDINEWGLILTEWMTENRQRISWFQNILKNEYDKENGRPV